MGDSTRLNDFRKIHWHEKIIPGYKISFTFPLSLNVPFPGQDDPMDDLSPYKNNLGESSNYFLSGGVLINFKNGINRGISAGVELDYFPGKTFRTTFLTELHFLSHMRIDLPGSNRWATSGLGFGVLSKWGISRMMTPDLGKFLDEYYLLVTLIEYHFLYLDVDLNLNAPILRRTFDPLYADGGLFVRFEYNFRKK